MKGWLEGGGKAGAGAEEGTANSQVLLNHFSRNKTMSSRNLERPRLVFSTFQQLNTYKLKETAKHMRFLKQRTGQLKQRSIQVRTESAPQKLLQNHTKKKKVLLQLNCLCKNFVYSSIINFSFYPGLNKAPHNDGG